MNYDVIIIGSGPAGLSAVVYLKRAGFNVCIAEKEYFSGGQILLTEKVENYLGFESIGGFDLAQKFRSHAEKSGAEFIKGEVTALNNKEVVFSDGKKLTAEAVIIASGASHRKLGVEGETEFTNKGVSYCATCDGAFFKNKSVLVIGGGDTALEDALYLANICKSVTAIHRRNEFRAAQILQESVLSKDNISVIMNDEISKLSGDSSLEKVVLKSGKSLDIDGAFIAVGQIPNTSYVQKELLDENGYVKTDENCKTSLNGIYAVGDVRVKSCRQIVTAVADGAIVSRQISEDLK